MIVPYSSTAIFTLPTSSCRVAELMATEGAASGRFGLAQE